MIDSTAERPSKKLKADDSSAPSWSIDGVLSKTDIENYNKKVDAFNKRTASKTQYLLKVCFLISMYLFLDGTG